MRLASTSMIVGLSLGGCVAEEHVTQGFDDPQIVVDFADQVVVPTYQLLATRVDALRAASDTLVQDANDVTGGAVAPPGRLYGIFGWRCQPKIKGAGGTGGAAPCQGVEAWRRGRSHLSTSWTRLECIFVNAYAFSSASVTGVVTKQAVRRRVASSASLNRRLKR